jgi:hypothetical protein
MNAITAGAYLAAATLAGGLVGLALHGALPEKATSVAAAVYLVVDLSQPYSGVFQVSPEPIEEVLQQMGKEP